MKFDPEYKRIFRTEDERKVDLDLVIKLKTTTDWTWADITQYLNDREAIPYVIRQREIQQQYYRFIRDNTELVDSELERQAIIEDLDRLYQMAYEAYQESKKAQGSIKEYSELPELTSNDRNVQDLEREITKVIKTTKKHSQGDNAFLNTMLRIVQVKSEILGLKHDPLESFDPNRLPDIETPKGINKPVTTQRQLQDMWQSVRTAGFEEAEEID